MFSTDFLQAVKAGRAFSWTNATYDYDAADTILTVCNDHTGGWKLNIEAVDCSGDTATQIQIHLPSYATWAGTAVTGVNLNADSGETAVATAKCDETGQATQGSVVGGGTIPVSETIRFWLPRVSLGYHKAIGVDYVAAGTAAIVTIYGYYSAN